MAIKLEMDGATLTFETTEEYAAFTKLHNETGEVEVAKEESKEEPIKVGDIITGNESSNRYAITTDKALMRVEHVSESGESMRVEVIKHVSRPKCDWHGYDVGTKEFVKTTEEEFDAKHGIESKKETNSDVPEGYEKVSFEDAKEGDYFLALDYGMDITAGKMYVLSEGRIEFVDDMADERSLSCRVEDEDGIVIRKIAEEEPQKDSFKVGDKVRVKAADYHHIEDGYVGKITSIHSDKTHKSHGKVIATPYFVEWQSIAAKDLTLVDEGLTIDGDVEVTNVNKIEAGDVVRTKRKHTDVFGDSIKEDRLAIVRNVWKGGDIFIKQHEGKNALLVRAEDVEDTLELVAKAIK